MLTKRTYLCERGAVKTFFIVSKENLIKNLDSNHVPTHDEI